MMYVGSLFVGSFLIAERFDGAILSILLSVIPGLILLVAYSKSLSKFPKQGLPEILKPLLMKWFRVPLLFLFTLLLLSESYMILGDISNFVERTFSNNYPKGGIIFLFFMATAWGATRSSKTVLSITEIFILTLFPLAMYIIIKPWFTVEIQWNSILAMKDYALVSPQWELIAASSSMFSGFVCWSIYNRVVSTQINWKFVILIGLTSLYILVSVFLIPIGVFGTEGVSNFIHPIFSAIDSIDLGSGIFERTLILYMLQSLLLLIVYAMNLMHVGLEMLKDCVPNKWVTTAKSSQILLWSVLVCCAWITFLYFDFFTEKENREVKIVLYQIRFAAHILLVSLLVWAATFRMRMKL
jgi:hypothetical protein